MKVDGYKGYEAIFSKNINSFQHQTAPKLEETELEHRHIYKNKHRHFTNEFHFMKDIKDISRNKIKTIYN